MAPKAGNSSQDFLYFNLLMLAKLEGPSNPLKEEYIKQGVFSKPNRVAFEHVMYFLINAYNRQLCQSLITSWPIVERKIQERIFRREIVAAYAKITSEESDFGLPTFSQSFLSSPGGERLEAFFRKFSALSLRAVLQRHGEPNVFNPPQGLHPQRCLTIARSRTRQEMDDLLNSIHSCISLMKICAEDSRSLSNELSSNQLAIKVARKTLAELQIKESTSADIIFNSNIETEIRGRLQALSQSLEVIKNQGKLVTKCESLARTALDDEQCSVVMDFGEHVDIAVLLTRTADTVESIASRFGRPTDPGVYPILRNIRQELAEISRLMDNNVKSAMELAAPTSTQTAECTNGRCVNENMGTPERFRHACQLLEDASNATPPLEFRPTSFNPPWQTISSDTESPPISSVADFLCAQKVNGQTPVFGRRPLIRATPQTPLNNILTPARPRSEIPIKIAPKISSALVQKPNENVPKVPGTPRRIPNAIPEVLVTPVQPSKVSINIDVQISCNDEFSKEDSAQNVLELAVSMLTPTVNSSLKASSFTENGSPKEEAVIEGPGLNKQLVSLKFSESMSDSPIKKVGVTETDKAVPDRKAVERRKSILELIERYRGFVPPTDTEPAVKVDEEGEPDEWKDSDIDISLDSDSEINTEEKDSVQFKFALSPGF